MLKQGRNNGVKPNPLLTDNKTRKSAYIFFAALYFIQSVGDPTSGLVSQPVRSLLRNWGESPASLAALMALLAFPWSIKPAFGLLSDFVPLLGCPRRKRRHDPRSSQAATSGKASMGSRRSVHRAIFAAHPHRPRRASRDVARLSNASHCSRDSRLAACRGLRFRSKWRYSACISPASSRTPPSTRHLMLNRTPGLRPLVNSTPAASRTF